MTDPKRWNEEGGDASALERELFRAGSAVRMSPEEKDRHWLAIAERAAFVPAPSPGPARALPMKAAAKGLLHGAGMKTVVAVSLLAGAGASAYFATHELESRAPQRGAVAPASSTATLVPSSPVMPATETARPPQPAEKVNETKTRAAPRLVDEPPRRAAQAIAPSARPIETAPVTDGVTRANSRLAEEAKSLLDARSALESGDATTAFRVLDEAERAFPAGSLGQEREALMIEAMARTGRRAAASERARAFLRRFPRSPHASNVRRFLVEP